MKLQLWGQTVASVLTDSSFEPSQRDLDAVEMWAGCKAVARAVAAKGEVAETVEIIDDADQQDLTTLGGFHYVRCQAGHEGQAWRPLRYGASLL